MGECSAYITLLQLLLLLLSLCLTFRFGSDNQLRVSRAHCVCLSSFFVYECVSVIISMTTKIKRFVLFSADKIKIIEQKTG